MVVVVYCFDQKMVTNHIYLILHAFVNLLGKVQIYIKEALECRCFVGCVCKGSIYILPMRELNVGFTL